MESQSNLRFRHTDASAFVGRERELATLREALAEALNGSGSLVLISGIAGIGKTTLTEVALAEAQAQGALVLIGRCYDLSETPPYGPWTEVLAQIPDELALLTLPQTAPPIFALGESLPDHKAVLQRVGDYFAALTVRRPVVLVVDDLHWADPASLDLFRVVARRLTDLPLLLIATYRSEEVVGEHPLTTLLPLLVREARTIRCALRPLSEEAINALVKSRYSLPDDDHQHLTRYLVARTDGNALFLNELLRTLENEGLIYQSGIRWGIGDLSTAPVPVLLRQLIDGRVARLPPETRHLLAIAAILGQEIPLAIWAAVGNTSEDELLEHAELALRARLLHDSPDGASIRFVHALIREAIYEALPAVRRRLLHRRAGAVLADRPYQDPDAIAYHFLKARDVRTVDWLVVAGERAQRTYARLTAAQRFEAALAFLDEFGGDTVLRGWLLLRITVLYHFNTIRQGIGYADRAVQLGTEAGDELLRAYALCIRGLNRCHIGDIGRGIADLEAGLAALDSLPRESQALPFPLATPIGNRRLLARELAIAGRHDQARASAAASSIPAPDIDQQPAGRHSQHSDPHLRHSEGHLQIAQGFIYAAEGAVAKAQLAFAKARTTYHELHSFDQAAWAATQELRWLRIPYFPDQLAERQALADEAATLWVLAHETRADLALPLDTEATLARLPLLLIASPWEDAASLIELVLQEEPVAFWPRLFLGDLGHLALARGDYDRARQLVQKCFPGGPATPPGDHEFYPALAVQRLAVALALEQHDLARARDWLDANNRWLAWTETILGRGEGQLAWASYARALGDDMAAREYTQHALDSATAPRQPLVILGARRLLGELAIAAGRYAEAQIELNAALGLAESCAAPYERALTLLALAEMRALQGNDTSALIALDEAHSILRQLGTKPALARAAKLTTRLARPSATSIAPAFGLTVREIEVLRLVATGLTDPQIAAQLFVSRNTIGTHLRAIYGKLGVNTRAAAARLAIKNELA